MKIDNWFTGIIEECDPTTNRVRVRMFGLHSFERNELLTTDLPWSSLLLPVNVQSAYLTNLSALAGKCAFGFFRDGDDMQDAVVIGIYYGWDNPGLAGYDPTFMPNGFISSTPSNNEYSAPINGSSSFVSGIASGGYLPTTGAHGSGLLSEFDQTLPGGVYDSEVAARIIAPASSQLNKNISYNGNAGPIAQYFKATNYPIGAAKREAWCAAFVCWSIQQSGLFDEATRPKTASVDGLISWAIELKKRGRVDITKNPTSVKPGDILILKNQYSHAGIVVEASNGDNYKSIDGNTKSSPGVVAIRPRRLSATTYAIRIVK
jgi:hypothetical protein